jgi:hypothetical protein
MKGWKGGEGCVYGVWGEGGCCWPVLLLDKFRCVIC